MTTRERVNRDLVTRNPFLLGFVALWVLSWTILVRDGGRALPLAPKPMHYLVAETITLVLVWFWFAWIARIGFFGVVKGILTVWTGSAWVHIFTTHTVHLTEVGEVVRVFRIRRPRTWNLN